VTVFDEDFTEDDMRDALEWQTQDAMKCGGCGGFIDETMAVGADDNYEAELLVCHKCATGERAERHFRADPNAVTDGLKRLTRDVGR
jgi:ribosome-binding protein aMBF1 (putative translation factor)